MKDHAKHIRDIEEIRKMMEKSSRFLSLSGLSGIVAGIIALIGAAAAHWIIGYQHIVYDTHFRLLTFVHEQDMIRNLIILAVIILILALTAGFYFSWRKARKCHLPFWDHSARRLFFHLFVPLIAGGMFSLILIYRNDITLLASVTLIFYGLALLNAGKYTLLEVQYLGISEIILGILAGIFIHYGLLFWAIGFGLLHIIYGSIMYMKYERKS